MATVNFGERRFSLSLLLYIGVVPELLFLPVDSRECCLGRVCGNTDSLLALQ